MTLKRHRTDQDVIDAFACCARPEIRSRFGSDSCIAATRVAVGVLEHFHIFAIPLPVRCTVMNKIFLDAYERDMEPNASEYLDSKKRTGGACITLGASPGTGGTVWKKEAAHLVSFLPALK
jgi:hypothetical protein